MQYKELAEFIEVKMRMSHIYQPVMLMNLLENEGKCHENNIAKNLSLMIRARLNTIQT
jgi:ATP adenylyltransferase